VLQKIIRKSKSLINYKRKNSYTQKLWQYEPYKASIYNSILEQLLLKDFKCGWNKNINNIDIYLRHDLDTSACAKKLPKLINIEKDLGLSSAIYIRADNLEYSLKDLRNDINKYKEQGFEIGLHTTCYLKDNYIDEFEKETELFNKYMGFYPKSFTVHGMGEYRLETRKAFINQIIPKLNDYGYEFTDCHSNLITYEYVIEDCHWDSIAKKRFIYNDFESIPPFFKKGSNYLILTHPCYWI